MKPTAVLPTMGQRSLAVSARMKPSAVVSAIRLEVLQALFSGARSTGVETVAPH